VNYCFGGKVSEMSRSIEVVKDTQVVYFTRPMVCLVGVTQFLPSAFPALMQDMGVQYIADLTSALGSHAEASLMVKLAGQTCYRSFGERRTTNARLDEYIKHILESGHGSVLEHAVFNFYIYGVSRSLTHELVRHRVGVAISQTSQRYVTELRFVERPEFQMDEELHLDFLNRCRNVELNYNYLLSHEDSAKTTAGRKAVRQMARAVLPNETETSLVWSANARAIRHFLRLRGAEEAEPEIRSLAVTMANLLLYKTAEAPLFRGLQVAAITPAPFPRVPTHPVNYKVVEVG
jgi:thymidylate synthase (FAD)